MYRSILIPLDGSPFAEQAMAVALTIAQAAGAKITLVRAWDPADYPHSSELSPRDVDSADRERLRATEYLANLAARFRPDTTATIDTAVVAGPTVDAIQEHVTTISADLVVMTTHGLTGWHRAWIGSAADALVRVLTVPVLLCRPLETRTVTRPGQFGCVLIPLDGSTEAEDILTPVHAIGLGVTRIVLLRVVRPVVTAVHPYAYAAPAWQTDETGTEEAVARARGYLNALAEDLRARWPQAAIDVDVRLAERVGAAIVDAARDCSADLVAVTTHARRGVRLLLGSEADKVLRGTHGSVLMLHPTARPAETEHREHTAASLVSGTVF